MTKQNPFTPRSDAERFDMAAFSLALTDEEYEQGYAYLDSERQAQDFDRLSPRVQSAIRGARLA